MNCRENRRGRSKPFTLNVGLVDFMRAVSVVEAEPNTLAAWLGFRRAVEQVRVGHFVAYP